MGCVRVTFALGLLVVAPVHADTPKLDPCACSPNKPGFHRAGALTGDWRGLRSDLFEDGIKIQGTYTAEVFAAPELRRDQVVGAGLASLAIDLDLATLVNDKLGAFHVVGFAIHGRGLSSQLMDVYGVSNNVADDDVRLFEAWIDQPIGPFSLRAGLLSADQQFTLASTSVVLLNATFGVAGIVSYNVAGPVYPVATPGAALSFESGKLKVRAAIYDGDRENSHGIPIAIGNNALAFSEFEYDGFKLGGWHHTDLGTGTYAIIDRQLDRYLGTFARIAISDGPLDVYADTGIRIGPGPVRRSDFFSLGIAFASADVGNQTIFETTYQHLITGWLTVQPDIQLLLDRNGTTAIVATRVVVAL